MMHYNVRGGDKNKWWAICLQNSNVGGTFQAETFYTNFFLLNKNIFQNNVFQFEIFMSHTYEVESANIVFREVHNIINY